MDGWAADRYGTTSILISVLFAGLVSYAYVLVDRANITADLTSVQRYSLNTPTLETIEMLGRAVSRYGSPVFQPR